MEDWNCLSQCGVAIGSPAVSALYQPAVFLGLLSMLPFMTHSPQLVYQLEKAGATIR